MLTLDKMNSTSQLLEIASANQDLFIGLNQEDGEIISGGDIGIKNDTNDTVKYTVDGQQTMFGGPGQSSIWSNAGGKRITFDADARNDYVNNRTYTLTDGQNYAFKPDPLAINLFKVS